MDLNATLDIIIKDLEETRLIIDDLKVYQGVPVLQIELAKSRCKSAAEMIALLKDLPEAKEKISRSLPQEKPKEKPIEKPIEKPAETAMKEAVMPENRIPEVQQVQPRIVPEERWIAPPAPVLIEETVKAPKVVQESAILADQFSGMPESFNEKLGSLKHDEDIIDILKSKPVSNLGEAIGINDKFLFIREIFDGSLESYNSTINRLETAATLGEALAIVSGITGNMESEAVKQLTDLLKRKFPSDE